jgi:hypothetical protein
MQLIMKTTGMTMAQKKSLVRFVAFPTTEYDVFSGYQPGQMVEWWENQHFEDHLCPRPQGASHHSTI